jgi:hypothetical protein
LQAVAKADDCFYYLFAQADYQQQQQAAEPEQQPEQHTDSAPAEHSAEPPQQQEQQQQQAPEEQEPAQEVSWTWEIAEHEDVQDDDELQFSEPPSPASVENTHISIAAPK